MRLIDADRLRNIALSNRDIEMVYEIDQAPTIEERPHGEWKGEAETPAVISRTCTACGRRGAVGVFCMWCGAHMGSEEGEEK